MKVFFLDRALLVEEVRQASHVLVSEKPEVRKVVLFGSVADGRALPSSDIDLLLVTDRRNERFVDRPPHYLPYFRRIPMSIDCFVYSEEELCSGSHPLARTALEQGTVLFERGH